MYYYIYSFLSVYRIRLRRYEKKMNIPKECPIFLKKPVRWFEVATPPTALFTSGDRNPLLMTIGSSPSPYRLFHRLRNCSSQRHSRFRLFTCSSFGTLLIPVFVLVNSPSVKCSERFISSFFISFIFSFPSFLISTKCHVCHATQSKHQSTRFSEF